MKVFGLIFVFVGVMWMVASFFVKNDTDIQKSSSITMLIGGTAILGIGAIMINTNK